MVLFSLSWSDSVAINMLSKKGSSFLVIYVEYLSEWIKTMLDRSYYLLITLFEAMYWALYISCFNVILTIYFIRSWYKAHLQIRKLSLWEKILCLRSFQLKWGNQILQITLYLSVFNICLPHSTIYWVIPAFWKLIDIFANLVYWGLISVRRANTRPCYFFSSVTSTMRGWVPFDASLGRLPWFLGISREYEVHSRGVHIFSPVSNLTLPPLSACVGLVLRDWECSVEGVSCGFSLLGPGCPFLGSSIFWWIVSGRNEMENGRKLVKFTDGWNSPVLAVVSLGAYMGSALTVSDAPLLALRIGPHSLAGGIPLLLAASR